MTRQALRPLCLIALAAAGCAGSPTPQARAPRPPGQPVTIDAGGRQVLRVFAPTDATWTLGEGAFHMKSPDGYVDIWLAKDAKSLEEAARAVPATISSEFKNFVQTGSMPFPGGPSGRQGLRLGGTGVEADDNDPGKADVIVFQAGPRYFIACTHGETLRATTQDLMIQLIQTSAIP